MTSTTIPKALHIAMARTFYKTPRRLDITLAQAAILESLGLAVPVLILVGTPWEGPQHQLTEAGVEYLKSRPLRLAPRFTQILAEAYVEKNKRAWGSGRELDLLVDLHLVTPPKNNASFDYYITDAGQKYLVDNQLTL